MDIFELGVEGREGSSVLQHVLWKKGNLNKPHMVEGFPWAESGERMFQRERAAQVANKVRESRHVFGTASSPKYLE